MKPETRYTRSGDVNIAYQVIGDGPRDIVYVPGWVSNVEVIWEEPSAARFLERLASFARLILFDKRGTGLSDRVADLPDLETRVGDVRAVLDAVGSPRATLLGISEGGPMSVLFAATHPERTAGLIMLGSFPRRTSAPDFPYGASPEAFATLVEQAERGWGGSSQIEVRAPSRAGDVRFCEWYSRYLRMSASPGAVRQLMKMNGEIDVRHVLPAVRVPTLILHRSGDRLVPAECGRYMAERIPGAKYVELPGDDHIPFIDADGFLDEIEDFLTGARRGPEPDRVLATVLFTDIVDATKLASELGDRRWRDLLDSHHALVREHLSRFRGREIDSAGDGFLAAFDGPARAVRAASAIVDDVKRIGVAVRAGLHTGECEVMGLKLGGLAVHIGARVAALAKGGEILVSSTVRDLVAGSGLVFLDRGAHALKGVPGAWHVFAVERTSSHE
jgi:pimeloyl-ACP methyl ester carboxylesterase